MSDNEWRWQFRTPAKRTYDDLDEHAQDRITEKLDEVVTDQWRDPADHLEPLTGAPCSQLRIGAECGHGENILDIYTTEHRSGAYKADENKCSLRSRSEQTVQVQQAEI